MIEQSDLLESDPLARRLQHLDLATPDPPHLTVLTSPARRRSAFRIWRGASLAAVATAVLALTLTAAIYPGAVARLTEMALHASGLAQTQVKPLTGSAATANLKVSVAGGYADQIDTVLFVSIDTTCSSPSTPCGIGGAHLTDQFGTRYDAIGGEGIGVGAYPVFFQPLAGAAIHGAHLTLHFPQLDIPLTGTLVPGSAHELPLPAPTFDPRVQVSYQVKELLYSSSYLQVHTRLSGELQNVIVYDPPAGQLIFGEEWPGVFLIDPSGHWETALAALPSNLRDNEQVQDESRIFSVARPGLYHVVVATSLSRNSVPGPAWTVRADWTVQVS